MRYLKYIIYLVETKNCNFKNGDIFLSSKPLIMGSSATKPSTYSLSCLNSVLGPDPNKIVITETRETLSSNR